MEEKFLLNLSRSPKKYFSSIAHNKESSKNYFAASGVAQAKSIQLEMHSIAIVARDRHGLDTLASAKRAAECLCERLPRDATALARPARRAVETAEMLTYHFRTVSEFSGHDCLVETVRGTGYCFRRTLT